MSQLNTDNTELYLAVEVRQDDVILLRLLSQCAKRRTTLQRLETIEHPDDPTSATLYMSLRGPEVWHKQLPLFMDRIIGVTDEQVLEAFPDDLHTKR